MSSVKEQAPMFRVGDWVAFHFGSRKVSAKIVEDRGPIGVRGRRLYRVQPSEEPEVTSSFEMHENELEATPAPVRQLFRFSYTRQNKSNHWRATTASMGIVKGVKASGALYSTALWEGETEHDPNHATVAVMLEVDPRFGDLDRGDPVEVTPEMIEQARKLADEMVLSRHPRAQIEHKDR